MSSHKKPVPVPVAEVAPRPRCPICGMPTYSRSGTHPQCSQAHHDRLLRAANKAAAATPADGP